MLVLADIAFSVKLMGNLIRTAALCTGIIIAGHSIGDSANSACLSRVNKKEKIEFESLKLPSEHSSCVIKDKSIEKYSKFAQLSETANLKELVNKIKNAQMLFSTQNLNSEFDYRTAFLTFREFDYEKARDNADKLVKLGRMDAKYSEMFVNMCRYWPLIKFYSQNALPHPIDPRIAALTIATESRFSAEDKTKNKEGHYDVGLSQINTRWKDFFQDAYSSNPYWIDGRDFTYPSNNMLLGIIIIGERCSMAGIRGSFTECSASDLLRAYHGYASGIVNFENVGEHLVHFTNCVKFLRLLSYADKLTENGALIKQGSNKKFDEIVKQIPSQHSRYLLQCVANNVRPDTRKYPYIKSQEVCGSKEYYIDFSEQGEYSGRDASKISRKRLNWIKRNVPGKEFSKDSYFINEKEIILRVSGSNMYVTPVSKFARADTSSEWKK